MMASITRDYSIFHTVAFDVSALDGFLLDVFCKDQSLDVRYANDSVIPGADDWFLPPDAARGSIAINTRVRFVEETPLNFVRVRFNAVAGVVGDIIVKITSEESLLPANVYDRSIDTVFSSLAPAGAGSAINNSSGVLQIASTSTINIVDVPIENYFDGGALLYHVELKPTGLTHLDYSYDKNKRTISYSATASNVPNGTLDLVATTLTGNKAISALIFS